MHLPEISIDAPNFSTTTLPRKRNARVFNPFDAAYPVLGRTLGARRDNLKATVATLEKRLASLQKRADKVTV